MDSRRRGPIGIELVRRGILTQADIDKALDYQKKNPGKKIIEIKICDRRRFTRHRIERRKT